MCVWGGGAKEARDAGSKPVSGTDGPDQQDTQCTAATVLFLRRPNSGLIRFFLAGGLRQAALLTTTSHLPADPV